MVYKPPPVLDVYDVNQNPITLVLIRKRIPDHSPFYEFYHPTSGALLAHTYQLYNDPDVYYRFYVGALSERKTMHHLANQEEAEACIQSYLALLCEPCPVIIPAP